MISEKCLLGRKLMAYATPMVKPTIVKVSESNTVYRVYLENGMEITFSKKQIESLLDGNKSLGFVLLGIDESQPEIK